jgi:hypothetical protein
MTTAKRKTVFAVGAGLIAVGLLIVFLIPGSPLVAHSNAVAGNGNCSVAGNGNQVNCAPSAVADGTRAHPCPSLACCPPGTVVKVANFMEDIVGPSVPAGRITCFVRNAKHRVQGPKALR